MSDRDTECRALIHKGLRRVPEANYTRALERLNKWGLNPDWEGDADDSSFQALSPIAQALADAVRRATNKKESFLCPGIRELEEHNLRSGLPIHDLRKEWQFVIYRFELGYHAGYGFPFLDPTFRPEEAKQAQGVPRAPFQVETRLKEYLAPRSLTAIALLLFPSSGVGRHDTANFSDQRNQMKKLLHKVGRNSAELAATNEDERRHRGATSATGYEAARHPATVLSAEGRRWLRNTAEQRTGGKLSVRVRTPEEFPPLSPSSIIEPQRPIGPSSRGGDSLPVWLPWPDGFRDRMRDQASKRPTIMAL